MVKTRRGIKKIEQIPLMNRQNVSKNENSTFSS